MDIFFLKDADYDVYKRDYYPILVQNGFSWRMFSTLKIYLDMPYPDRQNDYISQHLEHYRPDLPLIYSKMITLDEWIATGSDEQSYWNVVKAKTSSLPHEIGHHLSMFFSIEEWTKAAALGGFNLDFNTVTSGDYIYTPAWEDFANHFESCIEGRISNEPFLQFVRDVFGIKHLIYKDADFTLVNDHARIPIRNLIETFRGQRLQDIDWLPVTREAIVISGEKGFN